MKLRSKLTVLILACGILPMTATITFSHFTAKDTAEGLSAHAVDDSEGATKTHLQAVVDGRLAHVADYFATIKDQLITTAAMPSAVDAVQQFAASFDAIARDNGLDVAAARTSLQRYHEAAFGAEYQRQNDRQGPIASLMSGCDDAAIAAQHYYLANNDNPLGEKQRLTRSDDASTYSNVHGQYHPWFRQFQETFGYYDVFLVDEAGRVVYSVFKEVDFGTSLASGAWGGSGLGKLYQQLQTTPAGSYAFTDYERYAPSYEAPASFIGTAIRSGDDVVGYLAFQMPIDEINAIMASATGLGETGEIFLVGPGGLMRSDSRLHPETNSVAASFRDPRAADLGLPQVRRALANERGIEDHEDARGKQQLIAFAPFEVLGQRWSAIARVDRAEIDANAIELIEHSAEASSEMLAWNVGIVLTTAALMAVLAFVFSRRLIAPIGATTRALQDIAEGEGDLTRRLDDSRKDELGHMAKWFNAFVERIQSTIGQISSKATNVTAASNQLMNTAAELAAGAERTNKETMTVAAAAEQMSGNMSTVSQSSDGMAATMRTVAASVEEMTASIGEVATNAESAAKVADNAAELTSSSHAQISALGTAANEIGRVIETIQDIAEQTNLLALNATIEAARAGEAGKGFSVVANEVKDLARQTAEATHDIRERIERIQESTQGTVDAIKEIDQVIAKVNAASKSIAIAVGEQRTATQEIASNLSQSSGNFEVVNRNVAECVRTSTEISASIQSVERNARQTASGAENTAMSGKELGNLAQELQSLMSHFKV